MPEEVRPQYEDPVTKPSDRVVALGSSKHFEIGRPAASCVLTAPIKIPENKTSAFPRRQKYTARNGERVLAGIDDAAADVLEIAPSFSRAMRRGESR
jgi:hypothetical protein